MHLFFSAGKMFIFIALAFFGTAFLFNLFSPPVYGQTANAWNIQRDATPPNLLNFFYSTAGSTIFQLNPNGQSGVRSIVDLDNPSTYFLDPNGTSSLFKLGIGTNAPTTKLDVQGNTLIKGLNQFPLSLRAGSAGIPFASVILFQKNDGSNLWQFGSSPVTGASQAFGLYDQVAAAWRWNIDGSGNVGIGTTVPAAKLVVNNNAASFPLPLLNTVAQIVGADATSPRLGIESFAGTGVFDFRRANNTAASPQALAADDVIGQITAFGYGSTGYSGGIRAGIRLNSSQAWTDANQGTYLTFLTTSNNTAAIAERMRIDNAGNVGIGTTTPTQKLEVYGNSASVLPLLRLQNANVNGWASAMDFYTQYGGIPYSTARIQSGAYSNFGGQISLDVANPSRALITRMQIATTGDATFFGSVTNCTIGNGTSATACSSDARLKKNVTNISPILDKIIALRPITFNWKDPNKPQDTHMGFIAQEVEKLFPDLVETGPDGYKMLEYGGLVTPLVKSVQELNTKTEALTNQIKNQQEEIDQLKEEISQLKNR